MKIKKITIEVETDILEDKTFVLSDFINQTNSTINRKSINTTNHQTKYQPYVQTINHIISIGLRCDSYIMEEVKQPIDKIN